jgi:hypothetical protein
MLRDIAEIAQCVCVTPWRRSEHPKSKHRLRWWRHTIFIGNEVYDALEMSHYYSSKSKIKPAYDLSLLQLGRIFHCWITEHSRQKMPLYFASWPFG